MEKNRIILAYIITLILTFECMSECFAIDALEATNIINQAELELNSSFTLVFEAQESGADISELIAKLNLAGDFLSKAYLAIRAGDYELAYSSALDCIHTLEGVGIEANILKFESQRLQNNNIFLNVILSSIGLVFLVIIGFLCWKGFKNWYFRKILNKKPKIEVI